jgi:hypothetical protein
MEVLDAAECTLYGNNLSHTIFNKADKDGKVRTIIVVDANDEESIYSLNKLLKLNNHIDNNP